jgi:hypothetical protein
MSSDLQMNVSTRLGSVIGDQSAIENGMRGITSATRAANREVGEMQNKASRHFKDMTRDAEGLNAKMKELGEVLHKGGGRGQLGEIGHGIGRISGLLGMGAGLGAVGIGIAAISGGMEILSNISERHIEQLKEQIELEKKLKDTMKEAVEQDIEDGRAGLSFDKSQRPLAALGGQAAVREASRFADTYSIPLEEAQNTVKSSYSLPPNMRAIAQMASGMFGKTGIGSSEEGMKSILDNGYLAQGAAITPAELTAATKSPQAMNAFLGNAVQRAKRIASGLISDKTGTPFQPEAVDTALSNVGQDPLAQAADDQKRAENEAAALEIAKAKLVADATRKHNIDIANRGAAGARGLIKEGEERASEAIRKHDAMSWFDTAMAIKDMMLLRGSKFADDLNSATHEIQSGKDLLKMYNRRLTPAPPYSPDNSFNQQNNVEH